MVRSRPFFSRCILQQYFAITNFHVCFSLCERVPETYSEEISHSVLLLLGNAKRSGQPVNMRDDGEDPHYEQKGKARVHMIPRERPKTPPTDAEFTEINEHRNLNHLPSCPISPTPPPSTYNSQHQLLGVAVPRKCWAVPIFPAAYKRPVKPGQMRVFPPKKPPGSVQRSPLSRDPVCPKSRNFSSLLDLKTQYSLFSPRPFPSAARAPGLPVLLPIVTRGGRKEEEEKGGESGGREKEVWRGPTDAEDAQLARSTDRPTDRPTGGARRAPPRTREESAPGGRQTGGGRDRERKARAMQAAPLPTCGEYDPLDAHLDELEEPGANFLQGDGARELVWGGREKGGGREAVELTRRVVCVGVRQTLSRRRGPTA